MFASPFALPLAFSFLFRATAAIDLQVNSGDSIKAAAKILASGIVGAYIDQPQGNPIGIFPDTYYWWEAGAVWNGIVEYSHLTGDSQFDDVVAKAMQAQVGENDAFMPVNQTKTLGNSDQSFWGLAALTAAEVGFTNPTQGSWLDLAKNVFETQVMRWDNSSCSGGLRWQIYSFNVGYDYKDSTSNGNFFLLSARLAQLTGNKTYSEWADKSFTWMQDVGLITNKYLVFDGTKTETECASINKIQWSYPYGVVTEGAAIMYNLTNGNDTWKSAVSGFVDSLSLFQDKNTTIVVESVCEKANSCNIDQKAFKGLATRSLARAAIAAPFIAATIHPVLEQSAVGATKGCTDEKNVECTFSWLTQTVDSSAEGPNGNGLSETLSSLEVVQALLYKDSVVSSTSTNNGNPTPSGTGASATVTTSGSSAAESIKVFWGGMAFAAIFAMLV